MAEFFRLYRRKGFGKTLIFRRDKIALFSLTLSIMIFSFSISTNGLEYSDKVTKNESNFLLQNVKGSVDPTSFKSVWDTTLTSDGSSGTNQVKLPLESNGIYDFTVNWGDNNIDTITDWDQSEVTHTYSSSGVYNINITGTIVGWRFPANWSDSSKVIEISQWGNLRLGNSGAYFIDCINLNLTTTGILNLTGTTTLAGAFIGCETIGSSGNLGGWNVSGVTNMDSMFRGAELFNQDIGGWNVSSVTNLFGMFLEAKAFNQDIGGWDVSAVTNMMSLFSGATAFNQDIGGWNVSVVTDTGYMFHAANAFNQDIGRWNVSAVTDMEYTFYGAMAFNQDISRWNVSAVNDMKYMFYGATAFNQDIGDWNVSSVTDMGYMFYDVTLTADNYDNLLIKWANLSLQDRIYFSAGNSMYSSNATTARQFILDTFEWTIIDGGLIRDTPIISGYNFALIPSILLGLIILTLKIRNKKNQDYPSQ